MSVNYATSSGSAAAGSDFGERELQLISWAAGDTANKTIIVNLTNDGLEGRATKRSL